MANSVSDMLSNVRAKSRILRTVRAFALVFLISSLAPRSLRAEPMHEFIVSCAYGVLAGTLVGAASLAFQEHPGDNLNNIARGASIGLYAGILLGLYVVYVSPSDAAAPSQEAVPTAQLSAPLNSKTVLSQAPNWFLTPVVNRASSEVAGLAASFQARF